MYILPCIFIAFLGSIISRLKIMSTTNALIEVNNLSYQSLISLMNNNPVQHLEEVPFGDFQLELDLVHEVYNYSEETGYCRCYAVNVDGKYAGYMLVLASEMIHHRGHIQAITDSFYITPVHRGTGAFKALLAYVEADLKSNGIRFLTVGLNPNMPHFAKVDRGLLQLGYINTEYSVTKEL